MNGIPNMMGTLTPGAGQNSGIFRCGLHLPPTLSANVAGGVFTFAGSWAIAGRAPSLKCG